METEGEVGINRKGKRGNYLTSLSILKKPKASACLPFQQQGQVSNSANKKNKNTCSFDCLVQNSLY